MEGFLGTGASIWADLNLLLQFTLALALVGGMYLARHKQYAAHGLVQTSVVILNLFPIARVMMPSFLRQVKPQIPAGLSDHYYSVALAHAIAGSAAELLGLYVVLVAGTKVVPQPLRFKNYRPWMRVTLAVWWVAALLGFATYAMWYITPSASKPVKAPERMSVTIQNFRFEPADLSVPTGAKVEWTDLGGRHTVEADDGSFKSQTMAASGKFEHTFDKAGTYRYFCGFHGDKGGKDMAGTITVYDRKK